MTKHTPDMGSFPPVGPLDERVTHGQKTEREDKANLLANLEKMTSDEIAEVLLFTETVLAERQTAERSAEADYDDGVESGVHFEGSFGGRNA
jgi:hypothetical protein